MTMLRIDTDSDQQPPRRTERATLWNWLYDEAVFHLFPWSARFLKQPMAFRAAGVGLAVAVTATWILAAAGRVGSAAVIGWWVGWSAYELMVRSYCKPWVKEGPWWGRNYRPAGRMDLIAYVATKNLIIGVVLFLALDLLGLLR
jgi:NosR/NirI family nitrous oxide reductase transcriptional regulator